MVYFPISPSLDSVSAESFPEEVLNRPKGTVDLEI